jgi:hypothetical protein
MSTNNIKKHQKKKVGYKGESSPKEKFLLGMNTSAKRFGLSFLRNNRIPFVNIMMTGDYLMVHRR